jgi:hypothetical protein
MADPTNKGMISGMDSLITISGDEFLEVIRLEPDGKWKNYRLLVSKIRSNAGLSAYEVAVQNGFVGTVQEWLASLQGKSAYQIWKELGNIGDETAFIASIKGDRGDDGDQGKSVYEIAKDNGFVGTEADFLKTLVGKSAYQVALDNGFVGTQPEWLLTLKGDKGDTGDAGESIKGDKGDDGIDGTSVKVLGTLADQAELDEIPTTDLDVGSAYFVQGHLRVWNGTFWTDSESLFGPRGINFLGAWPDASPLPPTTANDIGDAYVWNHEMYLLLPDPDGWTKIGVPGAEGKSAYEIAVEDGFQGTSTQWLASLVGKSAYQVAVAGGYVGTEAQWLATLKGDKGDKGDIGVGVKGDTGKSAFQVAQDEGFQGTISQWLDSLRGIDGDSAYDTAVAEGFVGDKAAWLLSLVGKSAYQSWLGLGNTGDEAAFIASLKGVKGDAGAGGYGIKVLGTLDTQQDLDAIETGSLNIGDAYFVVAHLRVWNGTEWTDSESLLGPKGITFLGTWPNANPLPDPSSNEIGDAYVWKNEMYLLLPEPDNWVRIGVPGAEGKSAYDVAVVNGFVGSQAQWLTTLIGKSAYQSALDSGYIGNEATWIASLVGKSAYQIAKDNGFVGTEAAWLLSLKGDKGDKGDQGDSIKGDQGDPAVPFKVAGIKPDVGSLPRPGVETEAWYVGSTLYIWVEADLDYIDLGSAGGLSAYEIAKAEGFVGTVQEWLASLKGDKGDKGDQGDSIKGDKGDDGVDGRNLQVNGTQPNLAAIQALPTPAEQDAWVALDTGHLHIYVAAAWIDAGPFKGADGKSAYQVAVDGGFVGNQAAWLASLKGTNGTNGTDGANVVVKGAVANFAALPVGAAEQDCYSVQDTNTLYMWISAAWVSLGSFKGDPGTNGTNGTDGADGQSIEVIKVLTEADPTIPPPSGNEGKAYIDQLGEMFVCTGGAWHSVGRIQGEKGDKGDQGTGINMRGNVATVAGLPPKATAAEGDGYFTEDDKMLYVLVDGEWAGPFDIIGLQGEQGPIGPQGLTGKSINILGSYATLAALQTAHPTGALGDGYLIGNNLAIWTTDSGGMWIDVGPIRGPQGEQGPIGGQGIQGKKGDKGDIGSRWLTLPPDMPEPTAGFTGNTGDWAVSTTFQVFYKTANLGWMHWGQLVAGDVNSPLPSLGKVVRLGTEWVPLLVDEAPAMVADKLYARTLKDGSATNEGEWTELVFPPTIADLSVKDGKQMVRIYKTDGTEPVWQEIVFPKAIIDLATKDDVKQFVRVFKTADTDPKWIELTIPASGIPEAPTTAGKTYLRRGQDATWVEYVAGVAEAPTTAGKTYLRSGQNTNWVEYVAPAAGIGEAPTDGKQYVRKSSAWVSFDNYSLPLTSVSATIAINALTTQVVYLDNNVNSTAKDISLTTNPGNTRSMTVVVVIRGTAGVVTYSTGTGGAIKWNGGSPPALTGYKTVVTLLWDGTEWIASQGAVTTG